MGEKVNHETESNQDKPRSRQPSVTESKPQPVQLSQESQAIPVEEPPVEKIKDEAPKPIEPVLEEPVAKKPEPVPEVEKNVVDDENGWETAPGKNKKGKMNKGGK